MDKFGQHYAERRQPQKIYILHDSVNVKCRGQSNLWGQKVDQWLSKARGRGWGDSGGGGDRSDERLKSGGYTMQDFHLG